MLRVLTIGRFSLGNDEIQEARWSRLRFPELLRVTAIDGAHPPLEFLVQGAIERTAAPEWLRRVPGIVAGAATVALVAFLAGRWFGGTGGLAAGLLLACSPVHVRYSQEVRPYAIGLLFLLASLAALEEYRRRPSRRILAVWFFAVPGAAYTLYFAGLMSVLVSLTFIALYRRAELRPLWRRLPFITLGWAVLYAPWLPFAFSVARRPPPFARETLDREWLRHRLQVLGTGDWQVEPISIGSLAFWLLVGVGLILAWRSRPAILAAIWLIAGGAAQVLILQFRPHFPAVRHFLPAWVAAVLLAGYCFSVLQRWKVSQLPAAFSLALVLLFDARTLRAYYDHGRPEWDRIASTLRQSVRPGEHLVAANSWVFRNLGYYWTDRGLGLPDVPLERAGEEISGPSWLVIAVCPMSQKARSQIVELPVRGLYPTTNGCEIRFVPAGARLAFPQGICLRDT